MKFFFILLFCFLFLFGCKNDNPDKKRLEINTMKLIMWDMLKADEWYIRKSLADSTLKKKREDIRLYEQVFLLHHITRKQYYYSYQYYEAHPVEFKVLIDSVDAFANREKEKLISIHKQSK